MRKGHFYPNLVKNIVLLKSIHEGIITNSGNSVRLLTTTSYLKKMRNLIYGYMLFFSCGMKKGHFPPNLVKNTIFCFYICVLAYGEANTDTWNLFKHQITVYFYSK